MSDYSNKAYQKFRKQYDEKVMAFSQGQEIQLEQIETMAQNLWNEFTDSQKKQFEESDPEEVIDLEDQTITVEE